MHDKWKCCFAVIVIDLTMPLYRTLYCYMHSTLIVSHLFCDYVFSIRFYLECLLFWCVTY